jgi:hypothetical protein
MKNKKNEEIALNRDNWTCCKCGIPTTNVTYRISAVPLAKIMFDKKIISHPHNIVTACIKCSAGYNLDILSKKALELADLIEKIKNEPGDNALNIFIDDFLSGR